MQKLHALNHKELKNLKNVLLSQFGIPSLPSGTYFQNSEKNIFFFTGSLIPLDGHTMVNALGLYIGEFRHEMIRLSMEGAQLLSGFTTKNSLELSANDVKTWFQGESITLNTSPGWYVLNYDGHAVGCGQIKENKLMNYCPKSRRVLHLH